jgi:hypothetical protein
VFNEGAFFLLAPVSTGAHNGPVTRSLVTIVRRMNASSSSLIRDDCIISPHAWYAHSGETVSEQRPNDTAKRTLIKGLAFCVLENDSAVFCCVAPCSLLEV